MWLFNSGIEGIMRKGIFKNRIQVGTFNSISVGVKPVLSGLDLTTVTFDFFCFSFNELKTSDV